MRGSTSDMLQTPSKRQLPAPKCYKFLTSMERKRFQLQNIAKTVEMASSSKMLQTARKMGRKVDPQRMPKWKIKQNNSGPTYVYVYVYVDANPRSICICIRRCKCIYVRIYVRMIYTHIITYTMYILQYDVDTYI